MSAGSHPTGEIHPRSLALLAREGINNSIAAAAPSSALLRQRAGAELPEIDAVATRHARRYAVVPMLSTEPVGVDRLLELAAGRRPVTHGD
jgi:hypothetical protein